MAHFHLNWSLASLASVTTAALVLAGVSACQAPGDVAPAASAEHAELSPNSAKAIATDMVSKLAEIVGPGTGTVVLNSDGSPFGEALAASLKGTGYAVATPDQKTVGGKLIYLTYGADSFEGSLLARLSTSSVDLGRAYIVTSTGATPSSPLSIIRRG